MVDSGPEEKYSIQDNIFFPETNNGCILVAFTLAFISPEEAVPPCWTVMFRQAPTTDKPDVDSREAIHVF